MSKSTPTPSPRKDHQPVVKPQQDYPKEKRHILTERETLGNVHPIAKPAEVVDTVKPPKPKE